MLLFGNFVVEKIDAFSGNTRAAPIELKRNALVTAKIDKIIAV